MAPERNDALKLNNRGAGLLANGQPLAAIQAFQSALVWLKKISEGYDPQDLCRNEDISAALSFTQCIPSLQSSEFYMFERACMISADIDPQCLQENVSLISAILLFNMALAFHLHARESGKNEFWRRSVSLYRMSASLLQGQSGGTSTTLSVMAGNNEAAVHFLNLDFDKVRVCTSYTSSTLAWLSAFCPALEPRVVDGLLLNLMVFRNPPTAAQAA